MINKRAPFEGLGAERVLWDIGTRFAEDDHEVTFFCPEPDGESVPDLPNVSYSFVETSGDTTRSQIEFFVRGLPEYPSVYDRVKPDLVYDNPSPFPFHIAHLYGDAPIVNKVHTIYRRDALYAKDHPLVKAGTMIGEETYRLFRDELFTPVSDSTADRLRSLVNTDRNTVTTNLNGIDAGKYEPAYDPDSRQVLFLGMLGKKKGILTLLKAWNQVEQQVPEATLLVAGTGPLEGRAKRHAEASGLQNVSFLGYVSEADKRRLFRESLIYTLPTFIEGFPLTPIEAMASGCAVVSTDTYGIRDIITDSSFGCLVRPGDPDHLADALVDLLETPESAIDLARGGHRRAEELTLDSMLDRERDIVNEWLESSDYDISI